MWWVIRKTQANAPTTFLVSYDASKIRWSENLDDARRYSNVRHSLLTLIDKLSVLPEHRQCKIEGVSVTK
jgi:hypothetical protein